MTIINLTSPSTSDSPCLTADKTTVATGGSPDSSSAGLTKVNGNPIKTCHEFQSIYPVTLPRIPAASLAALDPAVDGMLAYDSTNSEPAFRAGGIWSLMGFGRTIVTLTQANVQGMYAAPVQILAAPGAGKVILVDKATLVNTFAVAAFGGGGNAILKYGNAVHGAGTNSLGAFFPQAFVTNGASVLYTLEGIFGGNITGITNQGLFMSNIGAAFTLGNAASTIAVHVWYTILSATV